MRWVTTIFFLFTCSYAFADWQYTRWGMASGEVIKSSEGLAKEVIDHTEKIERMRFPPRPLSDVTLLKAPYRSGTFEFVAYFTVFTEAGLSVVRLELQDVERHAELLGALQKKYGLPLSERESKVVRSAVWHMGDDHIVYTRIGQQVTVTYSPLRGKDNEGL